MSRNWKLGLGLAGFVVALNVLLSLLHSLSGGTPGGPPASSYSTGTDGAAAYATLLGRAGHPVGRVRASPGKARLDPSGTVVLLDAGPVAPADAAALRRFVAAGGRLVVGGGAGSWLDRIVREAPVWSPTPPTAPHPLAPDPDLAGVRSVATSSYGSWEGGSGLPLFGDGDHALLSVAAVGSGSVFLLADASLLENAKLDRADDAALGLALAGPSARSVDFLESYHGYGAAATGFGAVPGRWRAGFALLALAVIVLMLAAGRRLGPPQAAERELAPPRREYVESLGAVLARTRPREAAIAPVRARARRLVSERAGLGEAPSEEQVRAAAVLLGVTETDAAALSRPVATDADVLAVGRALAGVQRESRL